MSENEETAGTPTDGEMSDEQRNRLEFLRSIRSEMAETAREQFTTSWLNEIKPVLDTAINNLTASIPTAEQIEQTVVATVTSVMNRLAAAQQLTAPMAPDEITGGYDPPEMIQPPPAETPGVVQQVQASPFAQEITGQIVGKLPELLELGINFLKSGKAPPLSGLQLIREIDADPYLAEVAAYHFAPSDSAQDRMPYVVADAIAKSSAATMDQMRKAGWMPPAGYIEPPNPTKPPPDSFVGTGVGGPDETPTLSRGDYSVTDPPAPRRSLLDMRTSR